MHSGGQRFDPAILHQFNQRNTMKKILLLLTTAIIISGCSIVPKEPRASFGKKCTVDEDGTTVSSYVWIYGKQSGLPASKEQCNNSYITRY